MSDLHQRALAQVNSGRLNRKNGYCEIPTSVFVEKIDVNMPPLPEIDFYIFKKESDETPLLLRKGDQPYSMLALSVHPVVWIKESDFQPIKDYAETLLINPKITSALPPEQRMEALRQSAIIVVEDIFANPTKENIDRSTKVISSFVYVLMKDPNAYQMLARLSSHDPYTLQHSVGTAVHCIILGRKVGISDERELLELGMAGLLHDIGKVRVRTEVINKPGPLNDEEWLEMRGHSQAGYDIVKDHPNLTERTKLAILEHHEDKNGTGYPKGLRYEDVATFSKIVAICDIFNALTTDRTYSKAKTAFDAFQFMREKLTYKYDEELFRQMVLIYGGKQ